MGLNYSVKSKEVSRLCGIINAYGMLTWKAPHYIVCITSDDTGEYSTHKFDSIDEVAAFAVALKNIFNTGNVQGHTVQPDGPGTVVSILEHAPNTASNIKHVVNN